MEVSPCNRSKCYTKNRSIVTLQNPFKFQMSMDANFILISKQSEVMTSKIVLQTVKLFKQGRPYLSVESVSLNLCFLFSVLYGCSYSFLFFETKKQSTWSRHNPIQRRNRSDTMINYFINVVQNVPEMLMCGNYFQSFDVIAGMFASHDSDDH